MTNNIVLDFQVLELSNKPITAILTGYPKASVSTYLGIDVCHTSAEHQVIRANDEDVMVSGNSGLMVHIGPLGGFQYVFGAVGASILTAGLTGSIGYMISPYLGIMAEAAVAGEGMRISAGNGISEYKFQACGLYLTLGMHYKYRVGSRTGLATVGVVAHNTVSPDAIHAISYGLIFKLRLLN